MKRWKEWLSDNLRYILLLLAVILLAAVIWIGIRVYQNYDSPTSGENIEILTEENTEQQQTESESESETEPETQSESETESETRSLPAGTRQTEGSMTAGETDQPGTSETSSQEGAADPGAQSESSGAAALPEENAAAEIQIEQTEAAAAEGVSMTLNQACYFRSGPGYDYEVLATYDAGTSVEFLGMVEGWAEVRIDGTIGYMGRQFLS